MSVRIFFFYLLTLTEPRWCGNDIDKYTPNQTINIRHTEWIFRCLELISQTEYFRYIVVLSPRKWCWNQTHVVIGLSITAWPEPSLSTTAHILALRWFMHNSISTQHPFSLYDSSWLTKWLKIVLFMMTSSYGNIFRVAGPLCHRWIPLTKASDVKHWCFLWSAPEQTVE